MWYHSKSESVTVAIRSLNAKGGLLNLLIVIDSEIDNFSTDCKYRPLSHVYYRPFGSILEDVSGQYHWIPAAIIPG